MHATTSRLSTILLVLSLLAVAAVPATAHADQRRPAPAPGTAQVAPSSRAAPTQHVPKRRPGRAVRQGRARPDGVNPWLSLLTPEQAQQVDWGYWRQVAQAGGGIAQSARPHAADDVLTVEEDEPGDTAGQNDSPASAQFIAGLGTAGGEDAQADITGRLAAPVAARPAGPFPEDDGAIPLANPLDLGSREAIVVEGVIGDGPHGSADGGTGDVDFFRLPDLASGDVVVIDVDTPRPFDDLDPMVGVYDADGDRIAENDDDYRSFDSLLEFIAPAAGDYLVAIEGCCAPLDDPFDPASGSGAGSEGTYTVTFRRNTYDVDHYSFTLAPGDVVSAGITGAGSNLRLFAPDGAEVIGSDRDFSFLYPSATRLVRGAGVTLDHVAAEGGRFTLRVAAGQGDYRATVRVLRPAYERRGGAVQTVFLDFDGARVDVGRMGGDGVRELSPLSAFLERWGLTAADEDAVIAATVDTVRENLREDLRRSGVNPGFRVRIRHSGAHPDTFGQDDVSRVVVGGTIEESGLATVGIAESLDPGNDAGEETAIVHLDMLSAPAEDTAASLNRYIEPASDVVAFVGRALGNVIAHEIGHYIGNYHTDQFNDTVNLMDAGGGTVSRMYGVGPDNVGGTADDVDVDFGTDAFNLEHGFTGAQDAVVRSAFGLTRAVTR